MNKPKIDPTQPMVKLFEVCTKAALPSAKQLEKIQPYLLREFGPDELYIRQMMLANDQTDRSFERFDQGYLKRFAKTIVGKSVQVGHEYGTAPVGRFFDASLVKDDQDWQWIAPWFYMPISGGNELARDNIDSGVWSYVSIGASVDWKGLTCDICGKAYYGWLSDDEEGDYCPHIAGQKYGKNTCTLTWDSTKSDMSKVEAVEGSIVYLGCQYDAAIAKDSRSRDEMREAKIEAMLKGTPLGSPAGDDQPDNTPLTQAAEAEAQMEELEKVKADLEAATAENEALKAEITRLQPLEATADALIGKIRDEVKRLAGCVGTPETAIAALDKITDVEELTKLQAEYDALWSEKRAGNPTAANPDPNADPAPSKRVDARAHSTF